MALRPNFSPENCSLTNHIPCNNDTDLQSGFNARNLLCMKLDPESMQAKFLHRFMIDFIT